MKEHINLFQPDVLEDRGPGGGPQGRWRLVLFLALVFLLIGLYAQDTRKRTALAKEVAAMLRQRDQLRQQLASLTTSSTSEKGVVDPAFESILKERVLWSHVLREVSLVAPEGVWMTRLETDPTQGVRFEGFAMSYQKVTELISVLEGSRVFQDVLLDFSRENQNEKRIEFSVHSHLRSGAWVEGKEKE